MTSTPRSRSTAAFALMAVFAAVAAVLFATSASPVLGGLALVLAGLMAFAGGAARRAGR